MTKQSKTFRGDKNQILKRLNDAGVSAKKLRPLQSDAGQHYQYRNATAAEIAELWAERNRDDGGPMRRPIRAISVSALMTVIERHKLKPVNGEYLLSDEMIAEAAAIDVAQGDTFNDTFNEDQFFNEYSPMRIKDH